MIHPSNNPPRRGIERSVSERFARLVKPNQITHTAPYTAANTVAAFSLASILPPAQSLIEKFVAENAASDLGVFYNATTVVQSNGTEVMLAGATLVASGVMIDYTSRAITNLYKQGQSQPRFMKQA